MLAVLVARENDNVQVGGLISHLVDGGLSILQYAYDTIIFMKHDMDKAVNMKLVFCLFEQLSGLKINFYKSGLSCFGSAKEEERNYKKLFGCEIGMLPFSYLEIPIHHHKLTNKD